MSLGINVHVVLQAGGKGERMSSGGPVPKPLARIDGMPLIERLLRQVLQAGARRVTVITGQSGDVIEWHLRELTDLPRDLRLHFLRESEPCGNIGSLGAIPRDASCLMCFADLLTDLDFARLMAVHRERGGGITLASHYELMRVRLGELKALGDRVEVYQEKPTYSHLICSGIGVFEPPVLDLIPPTRPTKISDLVNWAIDAGHLVTHWVHEAFWMDVNTPEELTSANEAWAARSLRPELQDVS